MVLAFICGKMAANTKVGISMTRNMVKVPILGLMAVNIKVSGLMEGSTVRANTYRQTVNQEKAYGRMVNEYSGLVRRSQVL